MLEERGGPVTIPLALAGSDALTQLAHMRASKFSQFTGIQRQMLGCQVTQTRLSLIACIWPLFDQSRSCTPCVPPAQLTRKTGFGMSDQLIK